MMNRPIQIFHADRFKILRQGVSVMLEKHSTDFTLIGEADSFVSLHYRFSLRQPEILIISHKLLDGFTIDHIDSIREKYPKLKILMFTMVCSVGALLRFFGKVDGFIGKHTTEEEFNAAITAIANGDSFITVADH